MSQGDPMPFGQAFDAARCLRELLRPACERIEIAGSLRREKPQVRDIELVAVPRFEETTLGMFDTTTVDVLEATVGALLTAGDLEARLVDNHRADGHIDRHTKLGQAFKALVFGGIPVDLFIVRPPASWGCIFALRTGPGAWNTELVTACKAIGRRVSGGQVERWDGRGWVVVPTPHEREFFWALGQAWIEPRDRTPERVRIERAIADGVMA